MNFTLHTVVSYGSMAPLVRIFRVIYLFYGPDLEP